MGEKAFMTTPGHATETASGRTSMTDPISSAGVREAATRRPAESIPVVAAAGRVR
jgi:hypothetical protein